MAIQRYVSVALASILIFQIGISGVVTNPVFAADDSMRFVFGQNVSDQGVSFQKVINLSRNNASSFHPQTVASDNDVYVAWADFKRGKEDTIFRASHNKGFSFDSKINLSNDNIVSHNPRLAADANNVYAVWEAHGSAVDIFFTASNDRGRSFSKLINLSNSSGISVQPLIAASGNNVYVAWQDRSGNGDIFFIASNDAGATFGDKINLSNSLTSSEYSQIAAVGDNVYVAWVEGGEKSYEVRFRASNDGGRSFGSSITLSDPDVDTDKFSMAASGNNVYVVWGTKSVFFRASNDGGSSFHDAVNLSTEFSNLESPLIAVSGTNVHVVWLSESERNVIIHYRGSNDSGITFGDSMNLRKERLLLSSHKIHASGPNVYLLWGAFERSSLESQIFLRASNNNGESFGPATKLSSDIGGGFAPSMDSSGSKVYISWESPASLKAKPDIFFTRGNVDPKGIFQLQVTGILEYDNGNKQNIKVDIKANVSTTGKLLLLKNITGTIELTGTVSIQGDGLRLDVVNSNGNVNLTDGRLRLNLRDEGATDLNVVMLGFVKGIKQADGYYYATIYSVKGEIIDEHRSFETTLNGIMILDFLGCFDVPLGKRLNEDDIASKFEGDFYEKVKDLLKAGETRHYSVLIWVDYINEEKYKDKLECALLNNHGAKNVHKALVLSFVVGDIPLQEIPKVAWYRFVDLISDGEEEFELLEDGITTP